MESFLTGPTGEEGQRGNSPQGLSRQTRVRAEDLLGMAGEAKQQRSQLMKEFFTIAARTGAQQ